MDLMERVKAECYDCKRFDHESGRCMFSANPYHWDIKTIRKALGEEQKEEIVVPEKWKEEKFEEIPFGEPYNMVYDVMKKQNAIINCLEQIKERIK